MTSPLKGDTMTNPTTVAAERTVHVNETLADVRKLLADKPLSRDVLSQITARLERVASQARLFESVDFPPPGPGAGDSTRYRLNPADSTDDLALYLNSINPGKTSVKSDDCGDEEHRRKEQDLVRDRQRKLLRCPPGEVLGTAGGRRAGQ